ncbi:MAG: hypothetical protein QXJ06_02035 [Candidatus Aenigmatarchaeota archaeon]
MDEKFNFLAKEPKIWIIWISCLDKPRSIKEILEIWNYNKKGGALYRKELIKKAFEIGMLQQGEKIPSKEIKYYSIFDWFNKDFYEYVIKKNTFTFDTTMEKEALLKLVKKDDYRKFLDKDEVRKFFFSIDKIKKLYNGDTMKVRLSGGLAVFYPIIFVQLYLYEKELENMKKKYGQIISKISDMMYFQTDYLIKILNFFNIFGNVFRYFDDLSKDQNCEKIVNMFPKEFLAGIETRIENKFEAKSKTPSSS